MSENQETMETLNKQYVQLLTRLGDAEYKKAYFDGESFKLKQEIAKTGDKLQALQPKPTPMAQPEVAVQ